MKRILIMAFVALLWYGAMAYVLLEANPLLWEKPVRQDWLLFLFVFEIITATYPKFNETK